MLISVDRLVEHGYLDARDLPANLSFLMMTWIRRCDCLETAAAAQSIRRIHPECRRRSRSLQRILRTAFLLARRVCPVHGAKGSSRAGELDGMGRGLALREPVALERARTDLRAEVEGNKFIQFEFERQWCDLKAHCTRNDIRIMGDVPIYVALDSADVWANRELFELDEKGRPRVVAGVPPDYFSATGQLWGNPIYCWTHMPRAATGGGSRASAARWRCWT